MLPLPAERQQQRPPRRSLELSSRLVLSGRHRLDDPDRIEAGALGGARDIAGRAGVEEVETDLVLGYVNGAVEADTRRPLRRRDRRRVASEIGLDEVARHSSTLRPGGVRGNVRTSEL